LTAPQPYAYIELFGGRGWVADSMAATGHTIAKFDILLGNPEPLKQNAMDLTTDSGFWPPGF